MNLSSEIYEHISETVPSFSQGTEAEQKYDISFRAVITKQSILICSKRRFCCASRRFFVFGFALKHEKFVLHAKIQPSISD
jgi:hypothetical protein